MKILLISTNYSPELTGIGKYSGEMAQWLSQNEHDVRVICSPPYYPEWQIHKGFSAWKYKRQTEKNLTVYRCPIWVPKKPSGLKRMLHLASFALSSFAIVLRHTLWKPDIVICVEPPLFNSFGAIITSKLGGAQSVLHIQDFEVDAAFELGIVKASWLKKFIFGFERFLMKRFDRVSTISEAMLSKLEEKQIPEDKQLFFPNWVDTDFIHPLTSSSYREELSIKQDKIVALYSGNMGEKQGLEIVIEAARTIQEIQFIMCGSGSALDRLQKQAEGLENIIWLPLQPFERLNDFLNLADIHLLPQQAGAADLVMPSKLTGILSSGRPVVATAGQGTQVACVVEGKGIVVEPADSEAFSAAIKTLANDQNLRDNLGFEARTYAENSLEYNAIMRNFESELKTL
jgi:colanic acid biosynthesis glycosyl transferase WcaI